MRKVLCIWKTAMIEAENRKTSYHLPTRFHLTSILKVTQIQHVQIKLIVVLLPKQISSSSFYIPHLSLESLIFKPKTWKSLLTLLFYYSQQNTKSWPSSKASDVNSHFPILPYCQHMLSLRLWIIMSSTNSSLELERTVELMDLNILSLSPPKNVFSSSAFIWPIRRRHWNIRFLWDAKDIWSFFSLRIRGCS